MVPSSLLLEQAGRRRRKATTTLVSRLSLFGILPFLITLMRRRDLALA
jgi:hypothetical protein